MAYLVKGGVVVAVLGTTATGIYAGSRYLADKASVSNHLTSSGYRLISSIDNSDHAKLQWKEEFISDKQAIKSLLNLTEDDEDKGGKALEEWCSSRLKEKYSGKEESLKDVKKYCVLKTIEDWLTRKDNKKILTKEAGDSLKWEATYNKRKQAKTSRAQVGLKDAWPESDVPDKKETDLPLIKAWCKTKNSSYFFAYEPTYTHLKEWCTEAGTA